jgi:O-antigen ligase
MSVTTNRALIPERSEPQTSGRMPSARLERWTVAGTVSLATAVLIYVGVSSGGYPRGITGVAAVLVALALAIRATVAPATVRMPGRVGLIGIGALALLAAWQVASLLWTPSTWRAVAEFDRTILYLLVFVTYATLPQRRLRPVISAVGLAIAALALMGLATRLRPDLFPIEPIVSPQRLSFPLTYWNAMGVMIACGLVLCLHAASDAMWPVWQRVVGAALFPALATTLYFTLSRGGIGAAAVGLAAYVIVGRPRLLLPAVAAIAVPTVLAVTNAYDASALVTRDPTTPLAVSQGRELVEIVVLACLGAAVARAALVPLDRWLVRLELPELPRRWRPLTWGAIVAATAALAIAAGATGAAKQQYDRFIAGAPTNPIPVDDPRARLTELYNSGRIGHWDVALSSSAEQRWRGVGAGTFELQWREHRPILTSVTEAHSLYVETLSELGIVGLAAIAALILVMLLSPLTRRARRPTAAAVVAVAGLWALHAAIDWDWEVPAVTLIPVILAAAALAPRSRSVARGRPWLPPAVAVGALALAIVPGMTAITETRINQALAAYDAGDCATASDRAGAARSLQPFRPEPIAVLALCAMRDGQVSEAGSLATAMVEADPKDWEWRYIQALIVGTAGGDPRPALRDAHDRDPLGAAPRLLLRAINSSKREIWPAHTSGAYVWIHGHAHGAVSSDAFLAAAPTQSE